MRRRVRRCWARRLVLWRIDAFRPTHRRSAMDGAPGLFVYELETS
jgi:hypothetical protein